MKMEIKNLTTTTLYEAAQNFENFSKIQNQKLIDFLRPLQ
jgi:hypothetical protein